jgi:hypothetical protein
VAEARRTTLGEARAATDLASFEVERYLHTAGDSFTDLEFALIQQQADQARARLEAIESQQPDRTPFAGRAR